MLRQEYIPVYGNETNLEQTASLLLEIFLRTNIAGLPKSQTKMTREYCDRLGQRMAEALDSWDQLAALAKADDEVLWNPQTKMDLDAFASKFGAETFRLGLRRGQLPEMDEEFCIDLILKKYLCQTLSSAEEDALPSIYSTLDKLQEILKELYDETGILRGIPQIELADLLAKARVALDEFRSLGRHIHIREHSMMALIPLLPKLSASDSKKLVYALFIQQHATRRCREGFSKSCMRDLYSYDIPCPPTPSLDPNQNLHVDLTDSIKWTRNLHQRSHYGSNKVLPRLFGLPLPENIIMAMCQFMRDNLYKESLHDVDAIKESNAIGVLPFLERFCYENPERASIVFECLGQTIQGAIDVVDGLDVDDISQSEQKIFRSVIFALLMACVNTRAIPVLPTLELLYMQPQRQLMGENTLIFERLTQSINDAPNIYVDTKWYNAATGEKAVL